MSSGRRRPPSTPITSGPQYVRLTDEPARLRIDSPRRRPGDGRAMLEISLEPYDVPDEGGELLPFDSNRPRDPKT